LLALSARPAACRWLAASCHNLQELQHAQRIGVDFAVLAPVLATPTHPERQGMGWDAFTDLVAQVNMPVYALGGMRLADVATVRAAGGQGIAAIRAFLG
jgi:8-oxo-dGTP diphosphatase